jgi:hypothetical protein
MRGAERRRHADENQRSPLDEAGKCRSKRALFWKQWGLAKIIHGDCRAKMWRGCDLATLQKRAPETGLKTHI